MWAMIPISRSRRRRAMKAGPTTTASGSATNTATNLEAHRDSLYKRLELGYERIERGLAQGEDVTTWEDFWVALLREYERVCAELVEGA
jgi:hypothetical protein